MNNTFDKVLDKTEDDLVTQKNSLPFSSQLGTDY